MIQLYSYFRSSAAYRVRIALNLKEMPYEYLPVHLLNNGGEQHSSHYASLNPMKLLPTLVDGQTVLSQSLAIIEYLEEAYPDTVSLLPDSPEARAHVRAISQMIACDVHPLNNLRVLQYLNCSFDVDDAQRQQWYTHWITVGFDALEKVIAKQPGKFCFGDTPSLADCCLVPQIYNAKRFNMSLEAYPHIVSVDEHCKDHPAFVQAAPEQQPDMA
ncbi:MULTISPECIES: maleylacetoacetate isomerase [Marinomonas]|uniref:Maleylacetoacetate isomerase/maleylpyruvate isomerase n=2 Tax=Marinomonas TaxID=28253 RepID=A0A368ZT68_9GAMM|nr:MULTISPECIES: maleylacetoacetate isomerase [Marinomonas]MBR7889857.1 maleylacetoacetate isomerase [Marinomonas vulgaris]RCW98300.1 maleylacetoacetate isomerase/maleylpyruvate isomerase [Marinomonas foliarum]|tara:strand:+ start:9662 stop:10306 length:645 start_codon:yes stop_codon:yes gene_type:complete